MRFYNICSELTVNQLASFGNQRVTYRGFVLYVTDWEIFIFDLYIHLLRHMFSKAQLYLSHHRDRRDRV